MLATAASVPWWSVPGAVGALIGIWLLLGSNRAIIDAGLAGDEPKKRRRRSPFRGQSARSLAEDAANSSISIGRELDEWKDKFDRQELAHAHELELWRSEKEALKVQITHLEADNTRLRELVTDRGWAEKLVAQIAKNHEETLAAIIGRLQ